MGNLLELSNYHQQKMENSFKAGCLHTFLNPYSYLIARQHFEVFSCFNVIYFDGVALLKLFSLFKIVRSERISFDMTSLAPRVFSFCAVEGKSIYFIGSTSADISNAIDTFKETFPQLRVVGFRHGYFKDDNEIGRTQKEIRDINPDVVIAGLGTPLQEKFLLGLKSIGWNGTGFTCGGFFHQTAKKGIQYYPAWINTWHLRWVYRMYDEPKLVKRYMFQYPIFFLLFIKDFISYRYSRSNVSSPNSVALNNNSQAEHVEQ